jgi:hypothetical protein
VERLERRLSGNHGAPVTHIAKRPNGGRQDHRSDHDDDHELNQGETVSIVHLRSAFAKKGDKLDEENTRSVPPETPVITGLSVWKPMVLEQSLPDREQLFPTRCAGATEGSDRQIHAKVETPRPIP